jgi:hypothetical protein
MPKRKSEAVKFSPNFTFSLRIAAMTAIAPKIRATIHVREVRINNMLRFLSVRLSNCQRTTKNPNGLLLKVSRVHKEVLGNEKVGYLVLLKDL